MWRAGHYWIRGVVKSTITVAVNECKHDDDHVLHLFVVWTNSVSAKFIHSTLHWEPINYAPFPPFGMLEKFLFSNKYSVNQIQIGMHRVPRFKKFERLLLVHNFLNGNPKQITCDRSVYFKHVLFSLLQIEEEENITRLTSLKRHTLSCWKLLPSKSICSIPNRYNNE